MAEHMAVAWAQPATVEGDNSLMRPESVPKHMADSLGYYALGEFKLLGEAERQYEDVGEELAKRVIGQDTAVDAIVEALEATAGRMSDDNTPIARFAFLGPTGVGKTEMAQALADVLGEGQGNLVKIDCSQFQHGHEVSALLGSPPGYIGNNVQPVFAKVAIEKPGTVVLFDEIEKAHQDLHKMMLQIMDDGRVRLNNNTTTNFRNTFVIMTSNLGASEMQGIVKGNTLGFRNDTLEARPTREKIDTVARERFKKGFTPEFLNRLNDMIVFHPFTEDTMGQVLDSKVQRVSDRHSAEHGVCLSLSEVARAHFVSQGMANVENGARPLVRNLNATIFSALGLYIESGQVNDGTHVRVFHESEVGGAADGTGLVYASKYEPSLKRPVHEPEIEPEPMSTELVPINGDTDEIENYPVDLDQENV